MGIYAENISKLSLKEILKNLKNIEKAIKNTKNRIQRTKRRIEINHLDAREGSDLLESLEHSLAVWEGKHYVNECRFNELIDLIEEEIEQMKREGRLGCDEE